MGAALVCECAACCACALLDFTLSKVHRAGHLLILVGIFTCAVILGREYAGKFDMADSGAGCEMLYMNECLYRQMVYRASAALFLLFSSLAVGSYLLEVVDTSLWPLKIMTAAGLFVAFIFCPNAAFSRWSEFSRVLSFLWLIAQNLLVLDLAYGVHDVVMRRAAEEEASTRGGSRVYLALYLLICVALLALSLVGLAYLFDQYAGCSLGTFFVASTLTLGLATTGLSMSPVINKGVLTPIVCFSYAVMLTWYVLLSSPDAACNPTSNQNNGEVKNFSVVLLACFSATVLIVCIVLGDKVLGVLNMQGEGLLDGSGREGELEVDLVGPHVKSAQLPYTDTAPTPPPSGSERAFFHVCLALFSCLACVVLTSWGSSDGAPESASPSTATESLWLKASAYLIFQAMYLKSLHTSFHDQS